MKYAQRKREAPSTYSEGNPGSGKGTEISANIFTIVSTYFKSHIDIIEAQELS